VYVLYISIYSLLRSLPEKFILIFKLSFFKKKLDKFHSKLRIKMGNNAASSLSVYTCKICDKILLKPILLPCSVCENSSSNICQEHLNDLFSQNAKEVLFECKKCKTKLNLIKTDLKENTHLNLELQRHVYLSKKCQAVKLTIDSKLVEIEQCLAEVNEVKLIEYKVKICDHFYSLRNEVDIKRETVLENSYDNRTEEETDEINRLSANLIEKLDSTEEEFHKNLRNEIERHTNAMINVEEHKRELDEILRNIPLSENDLNDLKADCETKINQIKSDLIQIENKCNARLNENKFYEYNGEQERLLGEILYNNFLNECRNGNHFCIFSKIKLIMVIRFKGFVFWS
jgi:hypothetical protein